MPKRTLPEVNFASRNFDVDHGTGLSQMYNGFESTSANVFNMYNGEWYGTARNNFRDARMVNDRRVIGFARQTDLSAHFATQVLDGPDCGATLIGEFGNVARPCGPQPTSVHWKRLPR